MKIDTAYYSRIFITTFKTTKYHTPPPPQKNQFSLIFLVSYSQDLHVGQTGKQQAEYVTHVLTSGLSQ